MAFKVFSSLAAKLTLLVMAGSSLVFSLVLTYSYLDSRSIILAKAEEIARNLALSTAERMELELRAVQEITDQVAAVLGYAHLDDKEIRRLLKHNVQREPEIFGSTVAFEPFAFDPKIKWYAPYYCKEGNTVQYVNLATDSYNYESQEWYIKPKELKTPLWTRPYFDEGGGNVIMTTYAAPFFADSPDMPGRKVAGIVTADLSVEWLTKHLESIRVAASGYCFLISETGVFLAHPNKDLIMRQSIFSVAERPGLGHLKEVGRIMLKDRDGFLDLGKAPTGQESFLGFARLPNNGWSLGVVFPKKELFSDIEKLYRANAVIALAGSLLLLAMSLIVARSIARPLRRMADVTGRVASGELDLNLPESKRSDEVGRLAQAFSTMTVDLKRYIQELTVATAE